MSTIELNCLGRLADVHGHLSRLKGSSNELLKIADVDRQIDELETICRQLKAVDRIAIDIANIAHAHGLLVSLFNSAYEEKLDGGAIRCLLSPLHQQLENIFDQLQAIL